mgnify:CR=1 FL=1
MITVLHPEVKFGTNRKDENGEAIYELATVVKHPRKGIPCWHWEAPDVRPEEGEYWNSRGIGYDLTLLRYSCCLLPSGPAALS